MPAADFGRIHLPVPVARFTFAFDPRYRRTLGLLGIRPGTSGVLVGDGMLDIRLGRWRLCTPLHNVAAVEAAEQRRVWRTLGVRLSRADRGITFGTGAADGIRVRFHRPVTARGPSATVQHLHATVTVAQPTELARCLPGRPAACDPGPRRAAAADARTAPAGSS